jgi:catechol 2,3-dioxygenase-like lactoylglutathione lyase family enzyme
MAIQGIFYVFQSVSDLSRSKKFYGETLGWKLGTDEPDVAGFAFGGAYLVLHGGDRRGAAAHAEEGRHVAVLVDDVDAEHTRLRRLGLAVGELQDRPWGQRDFSFSDPDGYLWFYGQVTRGHE